MDKTGKVINIDGNKVYLVTKDKEFVTVKRNHIKPIIGELYTGSIIKKPTMFSYLVPGMIFIFLIAGIVYIFNSFSVKASLVADMNCTITIDVNNNNKIVKVSATDSNGFNLINTVNVVGNPLNDGLMILFDEAVNQKQLRILDGFHNGEVKIYITKNKKNSNLDLEQFAKYANSKKYIVDINNNNNKFE
ncbi:MAG: hypothetical protein KID00_09780 [Clostridium argentinense]|uniref:RsgI N-terminal anti-sigma domain-containing protein n=1 Tax=Clostridium faecium TaxID=2762223 RepID=A0ABR8YWE3_9CLOT|nr:MULTISPECIES: hypothetical protein [Clostridium]MBD8048606.1 hypothetical protein [Clostridium faecium]MBS5824131.1 hypothetical protein [Clostridium argentinense]MDU1348610.1 hypothetical protein [Clostridium argentinense]